MASSVGLQIEGQAELLGDDPNEQVAHFLSAAMGSSPITGQGRSTEQLMKNLPSFPTRWLGINSQGR